MPEPVGAYARFPSLHDRVVFISGGGSGIGASLVEAFAANGARVAFVDLQDEPSRELVERLGEADHRPLFLRCDVTDIDALQHAIEHTRRELGPVAVLVNNAARDDRHDVGEITSAYWDQAIAVNLKHQFFAAQAVRPHMRELGFGSIINFSSVAWMFGTARLPIYTAAKAGVVGMTRTLARDFGPDNIRINAIAPGAVMTERQRQLWFTKDSDIGALVERQCLKRSLLPEDIARVVLFLAADDSSMVTKQCITVDAGIR